MKITGYLLIKEQKNVFVIQHGSYMPALAMNYPLQPPEIRATKQEIFAQSDDSVWS